MRLSIYKYVFLVAVFLLQACETPQTKSYNHTFVTTYAELSIFYEKEKMGAKISDSLYQVKVADFFLKKKIKESDFRKQSEELMGDYKIWKLFLADVSRAIDSLKAIKQ